MASLRRLTWSARSLTLHEKSCSHPMQRRRPMTTSLPARGGNPPEAEKAGTTGYGRVRSEHHAQNQEKSSAFQRTNLRGPASPKFGGPDVPIPRGLGNPRGIGNPIVKGPNNPNPRSPKAATNVGYVNDWEDNQAVRRTYSDAQENHLRSGNLGTLNQNAMASNLDRPSLVNQRPHGGPDAATLFKERIPGAATARQKDEVFPEQYNVCKAQVHANLWQKEIRKQAGIQTSDERNTESISSDSSTSSLSFGLEPKLEDWETFDPPKGDDFDESFAREEAMMFEEFEKRRERNRIQIAHFVKQHLYGRRRPVDGWKYIINNFGSESKGAKGSALGERQTRGSDIEKLALRREKDQISRNT